MSINEVGHINESLKTKLIPTPKLLIKYHMTLTIKRHFPTRLVIPLSNLSATYEKVGYLGLKIILEKNEIIFTKLSTFQASQVKEEWEIMNWKRNEVKISSVDAVEMYPLITFLLENKANSYVMITLPKR